MQVKKITIGQNVNMRGQFFITEDFGEIENFERVLLRNGFAFYSNNVNYVHNEYVDILLVGYAWQTINDQPSPAEMVKNISTEEEKYNILKSEPDWFGRYVLIIDGTIYTDAAALMSVYYSKLYISSSAAFIGATKEGIKQFYSEPGRIMNWMPGPMTHYEGVYRLLPSQKLSVYTRKVSKREFYKNEKKEEKIAIEEIVSRCQTGIKNMAQTFSNSHIAIPLTGGYDSRSVFALSKSAGIEFSAFTLEHERMQTGDINIPSRLCETEGVQYDYVKRDEKKFRRELQEEYMSAISGMIHDEDANFYAYQQWNPLTEKYGEMVLIRGSVWGIATDVYDRVFENDAPSFDFYDWFGIKKDSIEYESLQRYFKWVKKTPVDGLPLNNRFFWEQRQAAWLSVIESGFDLLQNIKSFHIANCRNTISLLMTLPEEKRLLKTYHIDIIRKTCPELEDIPYATKEIYGENRFKTALQKIKRAIARIKKFGIKETFLTYKSILTHKKKIRKLKSGVS